MTVRKVFQLHDESKAAWFDVYQAPSLKVENKDGPPIRAEVPREDHDPRSVRRQLLRHGADRASISDETILAQVIASDAPIVRRAAHTGWRDEGRAFVSLQHVASQSENGAILPPKLSLAQPLGALRSCGDLAGWRTLIGVAQCSTAMTVALCAAFGAPLLGLLHRPNFALVLLGDSRCGKSTAQLAAAAALGFGREEDLPSLNATPAGLLAAAISFNDHMLPINEVGSAQGPRERIDDALRAATYALINGQDVLRHPTWTGAGTGTPATFQVICVLSSEVSPDAWAARNGQVRDAGEMARLFAVPVVSERGFKIFDMPPSALPGHSLEHWASNQFERLRQQLPHQRGFAFRYYMNQLVRHRDFVKLKSKGLVAEFESRVSKPDMSPVQRDIVAKFGVLYAGGALASHLKLLPYQRSRLLRIMQQACYATLGELPDPQADLRIDLSKLKKYLSSGGLLNRDTWTVRQLRQSGQADGFHEKQDAGRRFVIRAECFAQQFATAVRVRHVLKWLDTEGFLESGRTRTAGRSNEWAQKQIVWPDGRRVRSISIYLPNDLADLILLYAQ